MSPSTFFSPLFDAASRMDCPSDHKKKEKIGGHIFMLGKAQVVA